MPRSRTPVVRALLVVVAVVVAVLVLRTLAMTRAEAEGAPGVAPSLPGLLTTVASAGG